MSQYFENDENLKSEIAKYSCDILGCNFTFFTDNGVFSKSKLDYGSRFLLEKLSDCDLGSSLLDVGCGYGPIGIYLSKTFNIPVDMVDVNKRAIHLCKMNIKENIVSGNAFVSDCYNGVTNTYDTIVTNPPIRAGKKTIYEIVLGAEKHLNKNGTLYIVIRKDQGAKSMISDLKKVYDVSILGRSKGFFVIAAKKRLTS